MRNSVGLSTIRGLDRRSDGSVAHTVIRALYSLGFSQAEILRTLNISRSPRIRSTLKEARSDFTNRPTGRACFAAQLQAFCALESRKAVGLSKEKSLIHAALRKNLGIDNGFFDGLRELAVSLATPQPPDSDRGCWSLISRILQDQLRNVCDDYWKYLDHYGTVPSSLAALRADTLRYTVDWCRANAVHAWPHNARMAIECLLEKIDYQAAAIIRERFGIDNTRALSRKETGILYKMTQWRVGKLETKGVRQLKRVVEGEFVREIFLKPLSCAPQPVTPASLQHLIDRDRADQCE
jgi:hypothetical protein